MVRLALVASVIAIAAAALSGATLAGGSDATRERPTLRLAGLAPFTVEGRGFKASERVRLSANNVRRTVTAGRRGRFLANFGRVNLCEEVTVVAVGTRGSRTAAVFGQLSNVHCLDR
jgi:hypothetical protein